MVNCLAASDLLQFNNGASIVRDYFIVLASDYSVQRDGQPPGGSPTGWPPWGVAHSVSGPRWPGEVVKYHFHTPAV